MYSRVPRKRTGRLLENEKKNPTYTHLFGTIRLLIFSKKSHLYTANVLSAESTDVCLRTKSQDNYVAVISTDENL